MTGCDIVAGGRVCRYGRDTSVTLSVDQYIDLGYNDATQTLGKPGKDGDRKGEKKGTKS